MTIRRLTLPTMFAAFAGLGTAFAADPGDQLAPPSPGASFQDCDVCPEMVMVPAGSFQMGTPDHVVVKDDDEGPVHWVEIDRGFAVGKYEVTFAEWDACVADGGCNGYRPGDTPSGDDWRSAINSRTPQEGRFRRVDFKGWGRGSQPVIFVSWQDAGAFVQWISRKTGARYRLLSEAEWEYAARAGTPTARPWGDEIGVGRANCDGCGSQWDNRRTAPAGSFPPNAFGLHDMLGNVWEWTADCWNDSYVGAPTDGSAWTQGDCTRRALRGGSWGNDTGNVRSATRRSYRADTRRSYVGFRIARALH